MRGVVARSDTVDVEPEKLPRRRRTCRTLPLLTVSRSLVELRRCIITANCRGMLFREDGVSMLSSSASSLSPSETAVARSDGSFCGVRDPLAVDGVVGVCDREP